MKKLSQAFFAVLIALFSILFVRAQQPGASGAATAPVMYVKDFQAVQESSGSGRLISRLREKSHERSAGQNAGALAKALVEQLKSAGIDAHYLAPGEPLPMPASGWLIGGMFYSRDSGGRIQSLLSGSSSSTPNTEVSVTIADVAGDPDVPFAVVGAEDAIKGQGTVASWNPYIVAAKFVFKKVEGTSAVDSLAKDIATRIVGNMAELQQKDAAAHPH
ncbi:DUF4410 domain-containing protein [Trinickia terrae]|uniref:DUF4410 domain-containing protein n=1 Tax=Trinickia terrae TaxID=2571161 RepID=A0A4U1HJ09_9BURK|nr:DUF4410 domain-containing protein [Trinickia terrae]TKC79888.1 DUF4410 domain-containing protein [Trinickia terrae]